MVKLLTAVRTRPPPAGNEPLLLLFVPFSAVPLPLGLRAQVIAALRFTEPRARLQVWPGRKEHSGCHYRLLGEWTRPAAAHAALVSAFSLVPSPEDTLQ